MRSNLKFSFLLVLLTTVVEIYSSDTSLASESAGSVSKTTFINFSGLVIPQLTERYTNYQHTTQTAETYASEIKEYFQKLKLFLTRTEFRSLAFEKQTHNLGEELKKLEKKAKKLVASEKVSFQINFVRRFYDELVWISGELKHYRRLSEAADSALYKVIEIKALALALVNVYGELDLSIKDVTTRLRILWRKFVFWQVVFADLRTASKDHWLIFRYEVRETEEFFRDLARQIPDY